MESLNNFYQSVKDPIGNIVKGVVNKSVDIYQVSKQQSINLKQYIVKNYPSFINPSISWPLFITLYDTYNNPSVVKIRSFVQKYSMTLVALPLVRDMLIALFLKVTGFTASGIKFGSMAALIQSKIYGGIIAKGSLFSYLQSIGATGIFDPTLLTLLLLGGTVFYYIYMYSHAKNLQSGFEWNMKQILKIPQITVPKEVDYKNGKFEIKWSNINYQHSKDWKNLF